MRSFLTALLIVLLGVATYLTWHSSRVSSQRLATVDSAAAPPDQLEFLTEAFLWSTVRSSQEKAVMKRFRALVKTDMPGAAVAYRRALMSKRTPAIQSYYLSELRWLHEQNPSFAHKGIREGSTIGELWSFLSFSLFLVLALTFCFKGFEEDGKLRLLPAISWITGTCAALTSLLVSLRYL